MSVQINLHTNPQIKVINLCRTLVMRSIVYLCVVLAFNISRNAVYSSTELVAAGNKTEAKNVTQEGIPSDWEKTCKNESRLKDCDDILKRACRIRPKTCPGMIAKVPLSPLDKMCSSYCDVKENGNVTTRRPDLCNICLHKRGVSCSKTYPTLQLCWSDDVEHKCKVLFEHCKAEKKTYCKAMRRNMRFCENLKTADTYTAAYELYCHNGNGTRDTQRCAAIIDSLHTRELHIVYPICMKLCERQHEVCIECIEQYRDAPSNWTNTNETLSEQMIAKFCKENVKNEDICPKQTETTEDNPSSPNMRVVYIVGTVVAALIIIIFGVIIYLFFEMRQRRRLNKNKHNKSETGVSSAVSGASSTMSEDNSATRIRTLASQATVSQLASDSHMSAKDRTRKGKKQTKKRESQVGMGDDSRTGSRETEREGYSKKLESQLGNTTFNVSNTNIDYEITKGEGKRARAKPSTTKGRDTEIGGDTKIWEADKTTKKEGATEVDYELTMGEGKQPKKPNVRRKATETETGNETERVSEMVVHFRPVFVRRSILSLCIALTFVVYGNAEIPKDWLKTCTAVPETKQCDEILKEACFNQTKQCQGMIQKVPDIPLEIICLRVCDVKNATTIDDRPHLCNICLARRGNRCSKKYSTLQLCWSDDVDEECKEIFHECGMGDIKYCESLYIYTKFCRELNSTDGYINWYEKYCYKPRGRCTTLIESLRKRDLHIVYPMCMEFCERTQDLCMKCIEIVYSICMNLCEHSHGLCETCIEQYRSRHIPPEWRNDIGHPADLLTVKYCVGNVKNKIICTAGRAEKNTGVSEQTDDNDNPNMRVVYIVGTIVAALIIIIFGVIIYLFFEMRQRRRRNKNKHNKSDTGVSSAVSGVSSTMSEDNSATRVRTLASQPTVSQFATESHMSGKDRTRKGKKQTKKKESQVGMGDDSRTGSRETVREGHSKKLESQLGNTTFNVSNTNIDYEITKGEGKRARAKPSTTKGRDTETGGDTKIWEADKTTRKEGATEVDYELTMGEGKQPKKPNVRRKATETETGNETERVSEMK